MLGVDIPRYIKDKLILLVLPLSLTGSFCVLASHDRVAIGGVGIKRIVGVGILLIC